MIYLDNAATTKPYNEVIEKVKEGLCDFGNPSSSHQLGKNSLKQINTARENIASLLNCEPENIFFTSGGSESNNWVLYSQITKTKKRKIISSKIEHPSILKSLENFQKTLGLKSKLISVDKNGHIDLSELENCLNSEVSLVSIMYVNNEIGTIQNIEKIIDICKHYSIKVHTDAVQAIGKIEVDTKQIEVDFMSISGHKFHGPKGIGVLYVKDNNNLFPMISGGHQELGLRAGTHNVPAIMGMGEAARITKNNLKKDINKIKKIESLFIELLKEEIPNIKINAKDSHKVPGIINVVFPNIESKLFVLKASDLGFFCSSGSACNEGNNKPSHVLKAIGLNSFDAHSSVRFSLSCFSSELEIKNTIKKIKTIYDKNLDF